MEQPERRPPVAPARNGHTALSAALSIPFQSSFSFIVLPFFLSLFDITQRRGFLSRRDAERKRMPQKAKVYDSVEESKVQSAKRLFVKKSSLRVLKALLLAIANARFEAHSLHLCVSA